MSSIISSIMSSYNKCYTCFGDARNNTIMCINGDKTKIVRKYMHPTDDIEWTLWVFGAIKICSNNEKYILSQFNKSKYVYYDKVSFIDMTDNIEK